MPNDLLSELDDGSALRRGVSFGKRGGSAELTAGVRGVVWWLGGRFFLGFWWFNRLFLQGLVSFCQVFIGFIESLRVGHLRL